MHQARLPAVPASTDSYRLLGATLIDGTGAPALSNSEVAVVNGRIAYAGPRRPGWPAPEGMAAVELPGRTILPGFIDTHVHLAASVETNPAQMLARFPSEHTFEAASNMRRTLKAGVTTARDLAGLDAGYRNAVAAGSILGPRLHLAVAALSPTGGHSDFHLPNGAKTGLGMFLDFNPIIDTDDDVRLAVRLLVRSGADVIKVCPTGGVSSPSDSP